MSRPKNPKVERAVELLKKGLDHDIIAIRLGLSTKYVSDVAYKYGLSKKRLKKVNND